MNLMMIACIKLINWSNVVLNQLRKQLVLNRLLETNIDVDRLEMSFERFCLKGCRKRKLRLNDVDALVLEAF